MMECIKYISLKEKEQMRFNFQSKDNIFKKYCLRFGYFVRSRFQCCRSFRRD